ncbi:MAG TPA: hypothetical protein PKM41_05440 [Deltaproteobacteria bacterium]|nr:hypothetical protein [Deltaproteobacteria bacterium]HOI06632.1 hypothetical protein [Deltaproteobacteria bacterium]
MIAEKSHREAIMSCADSLLRDYDSRPLDSVRDALTVILSSIGSHALAGTEHVPDPEHSTVEKCMVASCFLTACSVPLVSWVKEEGHELDAFSLMRHVGSKVFDRFGEPDREAIVDSGISLFRDMADAARQNRRLEEWLTSVHNVTERYVLTEARSDCVELIAPLYLVLLMATGQMKA